VIWQLWCITAWLQQDIWQHVIQFHVAARVNWRATINLCGEQCKRVWTKNRQRTYIITNNETKIRSLYYLFKWKLYHHLKNYVVQVEPINPINSSTKSESIPFINYQRGVETILAWKVICHGENTFHALLFCTWRL
jgi:hypothetical protein